MTAPAQPAFEFGRVYRTREFARWGANPPRLARRLLREGHLVQVARGLFAAPRSTRFGPAPPTDKALMDAFLEGSPYVFTGSDFWNALGLGTTAVHAKTLVYNTKRSGELRLGGRPFVLRRVTFPESPPAEWYIIDLFEHAGQAATSPDQLAVSLERALRVGRFDREQLKAMSSRYGSRRTQKLVSAALKNAGA